MHDNPEHLLNLIRIKALEMGFNQVAVTNKDTSKHKDNFLAWLKLNYHGNMHYMEKNVDLRLNPEKLFPGLKSILFFSMNYMPINADLYKVLSDSKKGAISRYATGSDYHKLLRKKLEKIGKYIKTLVPNADYRCFSDSAPILEKPLAADAGLGWVGKNTLLMNRNQGSYFFIATMFTNLNLPLGKPIQPRCGSCTGCIDVCPTKAIVAPGKLDSRLCISYLTIEHKGAIPLHLRSAIGNRIYGCDDCQIVCPWNKFARYTKEIKFQAKKLLLSPKLITLLNWSEEDFQHNLAGSAIRRIGYESWIRNIAIAIGNSLPSQKNITALEQKMPYVSKMVQEHIRWAIDKQKSKLLTYVHDKN